MVEFGDGPLKEGIDNSIFILPAIVVLGLMAFFGYKLYSNLRNKELAKEEKKKAKQQRREKEGLRKQKKK